MYPGNELVYNVAKPVAVKKSRTPAFGGIPYNKLDAARQTKEYDYQFIFP